MNSIAQRALDRTRETSAPALNVPIQAAPPLPELVITGPINSVIEQEGKRYALDVVQAFGSSISDPKVAAKAIRDLTTTAVAQPSSYASGIKEIINLLKEAV
ncbi:hypothetical protein [Pseudomonas psychrophila]|uniref:hypothetical protein n=1 Tax=Pseudomonas psychrophila TaxID=122355 RepID=UPI0003571272|nr:hypothetical protein [Pseudomonas psychrophila]EPJ90992.1 hypothetical protein CF149_23441 [Pseudomonas psychrophila]